MGKGPVLKYATLGLISIVLSVILSATLLIWSGAAVPDGIVALGSAATGALATLMTTSSLDSHWNERDGTYTRTIQERVQPPANGDK